MDDGWRRLDSLLCASLAAVAFVTRAFVMAKGPYSVDGAILALGVKEFDFQSYHPHPPYYALVMALGKLLAPAVGALHAVTWLAVAGSAAAAAATYAVGRRLAGRLGGVLAAGVVVLSPVALLNGAVPLSYALEGATSAALAWLSLRLRDGPTRRAAVWVGVAVSVSAGLRPSSLLFSLPLALWAAWPRRDLLVPAALATAAATLLWLPATVLAGGGLADFLFGLRLQSQVYILSRPVWTGGLDVVRLNGAWLGWHLRAEAPFFLAAGAVAAAAATALAADARWRRDLAFLAAWGLPPLLFYLFVYIGWPVFPSGYLVLLLPPAAVASAAALAAVLRAVRRAEVPAAARRGAVAVVCAVALVPLTWAAAWPQATGPIADSDAWDASWAGLADAFPANATLLFGFDTGAWIELLQPQYAAWLIQYVPAGGGLTQQTALEQGGHLDKGAFDNVRDGPHDAPHPVPGWAKRVVLVERGPSLVALLNATVPVQHTRLAGGRDVAWFDPTGLPSLEAALAGWGQVVPFPSTVVEPPG